MGDVIRMGEGKARVTYPEDCTGCGACAKACPFNKEGTVIRLNGESGIYVKCDLCGGDPKCVPFCPTKALEYVPAAEAPRRPEPLVLEAHP